MATQVATPSTFYTTQFILLCLLLLCSHHAVPKAKATLLFLSSKPLGLIPPPQLSGDVTKGGCVPSQPTQE